MAGFREASAMHFYRSGSLREALIVATATLGRAYRRTGWPIADRVKAMEKIRDLTLLPHIHDV